MEIRRKYEHTDMRKDYKNKFNKTDARKQHRTEYMRKFRNDNRDYVRSINQKSYKKRHPVNLQKKKVYVYDKEMNFLNVYNSLVDASKDLGYHKNTISNFLRGKKNCKKYIFKYEDVLNGNTD